MCLLAHFRVILFSSKRGSRKPSLIRLLNLHPVPSLALMQPLNSPELLVCHQCLQNEELAVNLVPLSVALWHR